MQKKLRDVLNNIIRLEDDEWDKLWPLFTLEQIPPKKRLTAIGQIERKLYFVVTGIIRLYCLNTDDNEVTVFLFAENHFASCYPSFLTQSPSDQALETVEECTVLSINKSDFDLLHQVVPKVNVLTRKIIEQRFINSQRIFTSYISRTPEQRYLDFEREHGTLLLRVPQHIIASFLGITPVSLSRIRNRISRK